METCDDCGPAVKASWKATSKNTNYTLTFCNHHKQQHGSTLLTNWELAELEEENS